MGTIEVQDFSLIRSDVVSKMEKTLLVFDKELSGLRIGRASTNLVDSILVNDHGMKMPISMIGNISIPNGRSLSIKVWNKDLVKGVEKAIIDSNLGLNPTSSEQVIHIQLPPLTEERRKEVLKIAMKYSEKSKISLRNIRTEKIGFLKKMQKEGKISKDDMYTKSNMIQSILDDFIKKVDQKLDLKKKEISTI